ncbi:hypothetical protein B6U93_04470 [Candidatus Woesearchaeota archaeon ex4484_78]|nr:MAG: hypothetical protein B6U93_04470 [Candidatus Woesearchaeota archaeon ex4484_78]
MKTKIVLSVSVVKIEIMNKISLGVSIMSLEKKIEETRYAYTSLMDKIKKPVLSITAALMVFGSVYGLLPKKYAVAKQAPLSIGQVTEEPDEPEINQTYNLFDKVFDVDDKIVEEFGFNTSNEAYFFDPKEIRKDHDYFKLLSKDQKDALRIINDHYIKNGEVTSNDYTFLIKDKDGKWHFGVKFDVPLDPMGRMTMEKYGVWQVKDEEAEKIKSVRLEEAKELVKKKFKDAYKKCKGVDFSYNESVMLFKDKSITVDYNGEEVPFMDYLSSVLSKEATWHGKHLSYDQIHDGIESLIDGAYRPSEHNLELNKEPFKVGTVHYEAMKLEKHGSYYRFLFIKRDPGGKNGRLMIEFKVKRKTYDNLVEKFEEAMNKLYNRYGKNLFDF